jgi:uncharacterized protein DUF4328
MTVAGPWVCGSCRSVNRESATRCYSCRTPRALALNPEARDATPQRLPAEAVPKAQATAARALGATYRDTGTFAALAQVAVLIVTAITLARVVLLISYATGLQAAVDDPASFDPAAELDQLVVLGILRYVELGAWFVGLVFWGLWLGRVVANIPALGGGWPHETPRFAFLSTLIPGGNLYWTTGTLRESITSLSPAGAPRLGLITLWWLAVTPTVILLLNVGPLRLVRNIIETAVTALILLLSGGIGGVIESIILIELLGAALLIAAAVLAVMLVQLLERLQVERLAEVGAPAPAS